MVVCVKAAGDKLDGRWATHTVKKRVVIKVVPRRVLRRRGITLRHTIFVFLNPPVPPLCLGCESGIIGEPPRNIGDHVVSVLCVYNSSSTVVWLQLCCCFLFARMLGRTGLNGARLRLPYVLNEPLSDYDSIQCFLVNRPRKRRNKSSQYYVL